MKFSFSRSNLDLEAKFLQRCFEMLPGLLSWLAIIVFIAFAVYKPFIASGLMIAVYIYWILKVLYLNLNLKSAYKRLSVEEDAADWITRARGLNDVSEYLRHLYLTDIVEPNTPEDRSMSIHKAEIALLRKTKKMPMLLKDIHHCLIMPVASLREKELQSALESIQLSTFHPEKIMVLLLIDETMPSSEQEAVKNIQESFKSEFFKVMLVNASLTEPGLKLSMPQALNMAAVKAGEYFKSEDISFQNVILTVFDRPCFLRHDFLSCLTYTFMVNPDRQEAVLQPIPSYSEGLLERDPGSGFSQISSMSFEAAQAVNPWSFSYFLPCSMSLELFSRTGYLPERILSYRQAFSYKVLLEKGDAFRVIPYYSRYLIDAGLEKAKAEQAWAAELFPIIMRGFMKTNALSFEQKLKRALFMLEDLVFKATWPFFLTIAGWMPLFFLGREFSDPLFYFNVPRIKGVIFLLSFLGFLNVLGLSLSLIPAGKKKQSIADKLKKIPGFTVSAVLAYFKTASQYLLAQTRMFFGNYYN
ncbi:MAG: hypothetical protein JW867_03290 [Candidatus Omnitrophica bacterium]|nr:hypothetical protein [Candidatus Omnitrophota bacterium]